MNCQIPGGGFPYRTAPVALTYNVGCKAAFLGVFELTNRVSRGTVCCGRHDLAASSQLKMFAAKESNVQLLFCNWTCRNSCSIRVCNPRCHRLAQPVDFARFFLFATIH